MSATDPSLARDLRTFLQYNDLDSQNLADGTLFHIVDATYTGSREIMGNRKVVLDKGDTISFKLEIISDGPLEVGVVLDGSALVHKKIYYVLKGKSLKVNLTHTSDRDDFAVFNNLEVRADPHINYTIKELLITKKKAQRNQPAQSK